MKRLENKVAVIYGDGTIGAAMAKAFSREGALIFLTGRTEAKLDTITKEILSDGGIIETTKLDALNEQAVEKHLRDTVSKSGKIDISFNAIGVSGSDTHDSALAELSVADFARPITIYTHSHFITAKTAVRYMNKQGFGVILMHTPNASHVSLPFIGGLAPAWAAIEALCRSLSVECGPNGVRTVCLMTTSIPETSLMNEVWRIRAKSRGITVEQLRTTIEGMTHLKRLTTLKELTDTAVFVASDEGSAITGTVINLTAGMIAG